MINVFIAEDHPLIRDGLKKIVEQGGSDIRISDVASDMDELMNKLSQDTPDVVILDISLPEKKSVDVLRELKDQHPRLPILVMSMYPEDKFAIRSMKAGASGYLMKDTSSDLIVKAIRTIVVEKEQYLSPDMAERLADILDENN